MGESVAGAGFSALNILTGRWVTLSEMNLVKLSINGVYSLFCIVIHYSSECVASSRRVMLLILDLHY